MKWGTNTAVSIVKKIVKISDSLSEIIACDYSKSDLARLFQGKDYISKCHGLPTIYFII